MILKDCYTLKDIEDGNYKLLDIKDVLDLPIVEVPDSIINKVINGNKIDANFNYDKFIFQKDNKLIAIYEKDNDLLRPLHMFI